MVSPRIMSCSSDSLLWPGDAAGLGGGAIYRAGCRGGGAVQPPIITIAAAQIKVYIGFISLVRVGGLRRPRRAGGSVKRIGEREV